MTDPVVTVVVPYHRERVESGMLDTCLWSLKQQTAPVQVLTVDGTGAGAAAARAAGTDAVTTPWVAYLDSDDWAYPDHVEQLLAAAQATGADYLYSYFTVHDAWEGARPDLDPLQVFGKPFNPADPQQTTGTILVRTSLAQSLGWCDQPEGRTIPGTELRYGEDYDFTVRAIRANARIVHVPRRTWAWRIGSHNTSGVPGRGDSRREDQHGADHPG
jgi:glycosyltransferase involved in cell wall biosynthesis